MFLDSSLYSQYFGIDTCPQNNKSKNIKTSLGIVRTDRGLLLTPITCPALYRKPIF